MPKLEYSELLDWFKSGAKSKKDWKIGTEHEKFVFYNDNLQRVKYLGAAARPVEVAIGASRSILSAETSVSGLCDQP